MSNNTFRPGIVGAFENHTPPIHSLQNIRGTHTSSWVLKVPHLLQNNVIEVSTLLSFTASFNNKPAELFMGAAYVGKAFTFRPEKKNPEFSNFTLQFAEDVKEMYQYIYDARAEPLLLLLIFCRRLCGCVKCLIITRTSPVKNYPKKAKKVSHIRGLRRRRNMGRERESLKAKRSLSFILQVPKSIQYKRIWSNY